MYVDISTAKGQMNSKEKISRRDFIKFGGDVIRAMGAIVIGIDLERVEAASRGKSANDIIDKSLGYRTENSGELGSIRNPKDIDPIYHGDVDGEGVYYKVSGLFWALNDDGKSFGWNQNSSPSFSPHIPYEISGYYPVPDVEVNGKMTFKYRRIDVSKG